MKKLFVTCLACAAGLFAAIAFAEPGEMWEMTSKTEIPNMPMASPTVTRQACLPKKFSHDPRKYVPNNDCKLTDVKYSGNRSSWKVRCNQNGEIMYGSGEITFAGSSSYKGMMHLTSQSHGQTIDMTAHYSGRKLGKSCDASEPAADMTGTSSPAAPESDGSASSGSQSQNSGNTLENGVKKLKGMFGF
jgi:Protein of unknown function (DUF3617)